jgi:hypothetical protein
MPQDTGVPASPSGCQPTASAADASSQSGIPNAADLDPWDSRDYLLEECWACGGEGYVANCQDEIACLYPEDGCDLCIERCEYCRPTQTANGETPTT